MNSIERARTLFFESLSFIDAGEFASAEERLRDALKCAPGNKSVLTNLAVVLLRQGKFDEASECANTVLAADLDNVEALLVSIDCYLHGKRYAEALGACDRRGASAAAPSEIYNRRGLALSGLQRFEEAIACYNRAIEINPSDDQALCNRGNALVKLERFAEALDCFDRAIECNGNLAAAWLGRGNALFRLKREALSAYERALALDPNLLAAKLGRGNALSTLGRHNDAAAEYDLALQRNPNFVEAWLGRGESLLQQLRAHDALSAFDAALKIDPASAEGWQGRAGALRDLERHEEVAAALDAAFRLKPDLPGLCGQRLHSKMRVCNWDDWDSDCAKLAKLLMEGKRAIPPFCLLGIPSSQEQQLRCATSYVNDSAPAAPTPSWKTHHHDRIRIGYFSADFHEHATAYLMAELFELHDRNKFEVVAYSFGPESNDGMQQRLRSAFDRFVEVGSLPPAEIASVARRDEIDIAVDLKGHTNFARTKIFACHPAPIQVNYLGYPGTMGASYLDYIIADRIVIPPGDERFYSEKVVRLPDTYQCNDSSRRISDHVFSRAELGLPESSFVYCCFNNSWKITPRMFDHWMRILRAVEGSVLWLLSDNIDVSGNLRKEARVRSVDPDRLIFAPRMPAAEHLARHRQADLFIDTLPYNAHTTASDALWAGIPVLTCIGDTFAARVGASLLTAVGLSDLITDTLESYEARAIELGRSGNLIAEFKARLLQGRNTAPLFDARRFARNLEAAYIRMHERYRAGLSAESIDVPQQH
jgi:protein O-GlcNAc transferase